MAGTGFGTGFANGTHTRAHPSLMRNAEHDSALGKGGLGTSTAGTTAGTTGHGTGTTNNRGPLHVVADTLEGGAAGATTAGHNTAGAGAPTGGRFSGGARNGEYDPANTQLANANMATGITGIQGLGAHAGTHAGRRLVGAAETMAGHLAGNPALVARGQEKKMRCLRRAAESPLTVE